MSIERATFAWAGTMILLSALLTILHHPYWVYFTLFIGLNALQSAFTQFCPASIVMKKKFGMKTEAELAIETRDAEHDKLALKSSASG